MAVHNSFESLIKELKAIADAALADEVAKEVKSVESKKVEQTVYGAGLPTMYQRRGVGEGTQSLGDVSQMNHSVINGVLEVTNDAEAYYPDNANGGLNNDWSLAQNIEEGYAGRDTWYSEARPFISDTIDELARSNAHVEAMKRGLKKRGLGVV